jgi:hypothetical protein
MSSELSYTQKQIRKAKKKARQAEEKFNETQDTDYLNKRDKYNAEADGLSKTISVNGTNMKKKKEVKKTDDQLINESLRENRKNKNENTKELQDKVDNYNEHQQKRTKTRESLRKKKKDNEKKELKRKDEIGKISEEYSEDRSRFIKEYMKNNQESSDTHAQKEYVRFNKNQLETMNFKMQVVKSLMSQGVTDDKIEETTGEIMEQRKDYIKAYMKDNPVNEPSNKKKEPVRVLRESEASDNFIEAYNQNIQMINFKKQMINQLVSQGMDFKDAESQFESIIGQMNGECVECDGCDDCPEKE